MVGADEPFLGRVFGWKGPLDVFLVVISGEIERVGGGHVIVEEGVVLNDTETLRRVIVVTLRVTVELLVR